MRKFFPITMVATAALLTACAVPQAGPRSDRQSQAIERLATTQEKTAERLQALQKRLAHLETRLVAQEESLEELRAHATQKVTPTGEKAEAPTTMAPAAADGEPPSPTEIYLQAFSDYAAGRYPAAIRGFERFLEFYPANDYAANAQFWLGECYYGQQQYDRAVDAFRKVVEYYPQGAKTPEALLKMAAALEATGRSDQAAKALQVLRQSYPQSTAARKSLADERFLNILPQQ